MIKLSVNFKTAWPGCTRRIPQSRDIRELWSESQHLSGHEKYKYIKRLHILCFIINEIVCKLVKMDNYNYTSVEYKIS